MADALSSLKGCYHFMKSILYFSKKVVTFSGNGRGEKARWLQKNVPFFAATFQLQKYNLFHYHQIYFCFFSFTYLLSYQRHNERSTKPCFFVTNRNDR